MWSCAKQNSTWWKGPSELSDVLATSFDPPNEVFSRQTKRGREGRSRYSEEPVADRRNHLARIVSFHVILIYPVYLFYRSARCFSQRQWLNEQKPAVTSLTGKAEPRKEASESFILFSTNEVSHDKIVWEARKNCGLKSNRTISLKVFWSSEIFFVYLSIPPLWQLTMKWNVVPVYQWHLIKPFAKYPFSVAIDITWNSHSLW